MRLFPRLSLALLFAACGSEDAPGTDGQDSHTDSSINDDDSGEIDSTAPTLVSVSPEDGASGVTSDVQVVFAFSEPMDEFSVENALITNPLGLVELNWSDDRTTLTVTPLDELPYAEGEGDDPSVVAPFSFEVSIQEGATDLAGNGLAEAATAFTTLRRMSTTVDRWNMLTGSATASGQSTDDDDFIVVGDDSSDNGHRGFLSFDPSISWNTVEIEEATLVTSIVSDAIGTPYAKLGELHVELAHYVELDNAAFNADPELSGQVFAQEGDVALAIDVTDDADHAWANKEDLSYRMQWRLRFDEHNNQDGVQDMVLISRDDLALELVYLVP